jgi:subtilisin family serine protease
MPTEISTENLKIPSPEPPVQFESKQINIEDIEVDTLIRVQRARETFSVNGSGLTVAVLDTGLRTTHVDFAGRVRAQKNFTADNSGDPDNASDGNGHGTNVAGIIAANGINVGIAPAAGVIPIKVLGNQGGGSFEFVDNAFKWILENHKIYNITVANLSLGSDVNETDDMLFNNSTTKALIDELTARNIAVVAAAGNSYFEFQKPGMGFPAILRETVSVGAVYDANEGSFSYASGAVANSTGPNRITPFSQRLHQDDNPLTRTDIFAPGAPVTSSGIATDTGISIQHGTSQATPVTSGVILLMQEFYLFTTNRLPTVKTIVECLRNGGVLTNDGDDEDDNVIHTGKNYLRIDAFSALEAVRRSLQMDLFLTRTAFR